MSKMAASLDLRPDHHAIVLSILNRHVPDRKVLAFGSRATWTAKDYSDLDLAILGDEPLSLDVTSALAEDFRESDLPFKVDLVDWASADETFRNIIRRDGVTVRIPLTHREAVDPEQRLQPTYETTGVGSNGSEGKTIGGGLYRPALRKSQVKQLGDCARLIRKTVLPPFPDDAPCIGLQHIGENTLTLTGHGTGSNVKSAKTKFSRGDILFGKLRPYFRKVIKAPFDGIGSTDIWVVRATEGIDQGFLYYCMASRKFVDFVTSGSEGTRMPRGKWEYACKFKLEVPSLDEQRAIARILGALDDKIELNQRMNKTLEGMAQALFKSWFVDFDPVHAKMKGRDTRLPQPIADLFPDRMVSSEIGEIPYGWRVVPLPDLIKINPSRTLRKKEAAPYLPMSNMPTKGHFPDQVTTRPYGSGMRFKNGDTLVARITPCLENGKTAFVDFLLDGETGWGSTEYIVMRPKQPLPNEFAYCLARSTRFREFAIQNMTGTSGRQRLPAKALAQFPQIEPAKRVAEAFGDLIRPLIALASAAAKESRSTSGLRDALLPKLIAGELQAGVREGP